MSTAFPSMSGLLGSIPIPTGPAQNRIFDPTTDSKYANPRGLPYDLMWWSRQHETTFLTYGYGYDPTKAELKKARNTMRRAGVSAMSIDEPGYPLVDTIVIELASSTENGFVCAVRYYGYRSKYNRWEDDKKTLPGLIKTIQRGCQQIEQMVQTEFKWVKRVIFQTDSDDVIQAVSKISEWVANGFPSVLPTGVQVRDYLMLNLHIESLRATYGVEVLFWKVPSEHLPGAYNQNEIQQSIIHNREMREPADSCGLCTIRQQMQEVMFAKTGNPCCPNRELVQKYGHLKKGDTLPLTNTAGVDAKVMMEVDGSVAAEALKDLNSMILKAHEGSISKGKGGNDACGH